MSGSKGLVAQGLYSIGDALAKAVTLVSMKIAKRPPSKTFPFGAGKVLFISSLGIGVGLMIGGVYLGLTSFTDTPGLESAPSLFTVLGIVLSAASSELMHRYLGCVAQQNNNMAIKALSWDNRIDAFSSLFVLIGVIFSELGVPAADHIAAFVVSLMVMRIGAMIAWDATKSLLDVSIPRDALTEIARTSRMSAGVQDIKLVRGRSLGEYWEIYLHVAIDETLLVGEAQDIIENLKKRLQAGFPQIQHVWVITMAQKPRAKEEKDYWADHLFQLPRNHPGNHPEKTPTPAG